MPGTRVCVLTSSFPEREGDSAGVFVYNQVVRLANAVNIDVVYPASIAELESASEPFVRRPIRYPFKTHPMSLVRGLESLHAVELCVSMARCARAGGPYDLYHAHWAIPSGFVGSLVHHGMPLVVALHGSDVNLFGVRPGFRQAVRWTLKRATRVIAVSNDLAQKAFNLGLDPKRATVIPSGVDTDAFHPVNRRVVREQLGLPDGFLFVFVGNLLPGKRVHRLVSIMDEIPEECACHLVVIGDGPERAALEQQAASAHGRVHFLGRLDNTCVAPVVAACDAFVMASESEGLPASAQEAMACGTPVVALNVGGLSDIVRHEKNGLLASTETQLAAFMIQVSLNHGVAARMGEEARRFACQELSVDKSVQQTLRVYDEAMSTRQTGISL